MTIITKELNKTINCQKKNYSNYLFHHYLILHRYDFFMKMRTEIDKELSPFSFNYIRDWKPQRMYVDKRTGKELKPGEFSIYDLMDGLIIGRIKNKKELKTIRDRIIKGFKKYYSEFLNFLNSIGKFSRKEIVEFFILIFDDAIIGAKPSYGKESLKIEKYFIDLFCSDKIMFEKKLNTFMRILGGLRFYLFLDSILISHAKGVYKSIFKDDNQFYPSLILNK